nr:Zgc:110376 protein [Danio rerio]
MEGESAETEPLIQSSSAADRPDPAAEAAARFTVYRRRWFILSVLCLLNCSNAMAWLTFAPVAGQSAQLLCVSLPLVNWLSLVFVLAAVVCSFSSMWVLDTLGLRCSLIGSSWLYLLLLQALATPTHSPTSVCAADTSLNWTVPVLVMAGVCAISSCVFVVFFHTEYRRLRAEADSATEPEPTGDAADA